MPTNTSTYGASTYNPGKSENSIPVYSSTNFNKDTNRGLKRSYPAFDSGKNGAGTIGWGVSTQAASGMNK